MSTGPPGVARRARGGVAEPDTFPAISSSACIDSTKAPPLQGRRRLVASPAAAAKAGLAIEAGHVEEPSASTPADEIARTRRLYEAWQLIRTTAPEVFDLDYPAPLAIGAQNELLELGVDLTKKELKRFFNWWCQRPAYLKALAQRESHQQHLDNSDAGEVSPEHRAGAAARRRRR